MNDNRSSFQQSGNVFNHLAAFTGGLRPVSIEWASWSNKTKNCKFAIRNLDYGGEDCKPYFVLALQVEKSCEFESYSGINEFVLNWTGRNLVDAGTSEITMSNGNAGYQYVLVSRPFAGEPLYDAMRTVENAVRCYMLDRGLAEIFPSYEEKALPGAGIKIDMSGMNTLLDKTATNRVETNRVSGRKPLVSRLKRVATKNMQRGVHELKSDSI